MSGKKKFLITLAALALLAAAAIPLGKAALKMLYPLPYQDLIVHHAEKNGLDAYLVAALIKAESNFIADASSHKDARGLMQLTDPTACWVAEKLGIADYSFDRLDDPDLNIALGCWYFAHLLEAYEGDTRLALCAYNAGMGNVDRWLRSDQYSSDGVCLDVIPYPETEHYVQNTMQYKEMYEMLYAGELG